MNPLWKQLTNAPPLCSWYLLSKGISISVFIARCHNPRLQTSDPINHQSTCTMDLKLEISPVNRDLSELNPVNTTVINVRKRICILVHWFGWLKNACLLTGLAGVDNVKGCVANLWIACFCDEGENVWAAQAVSDPDHCVAHQLLLYANAARAWSLVIRTKTY